MPTSPVCCVPDCSTSTEQKKLAKIPYFRFPRDDALRRKWIHQIRAPHIPVNSSVNSLKYRRVCGKHFKPSDYERDLQSELLGSKHRWILKKTAVPSTNQQSREAALKNARREATKSKLEKCRMREKLLREMAVLRAQLKSRAETVTNVTSEGVIKVEPMSVLISGEEICEEPTPDLISTEHIKTESVFDMDCREDVPPGIDLLVSENNSTTASSLGPHLNTSKVTTLGLNAAQSYRCDSSAVKAETVDTPTSCPGVSSINGQSNDIETLEMECIDVEDPTLADVVSEPFDESITLTDICEPDVIVICDLDASVKDVLMQNHGSKVSSFNLGHLPRMNECSVKIRKSDIIAAKRRIAEQISKKKKPEEDSDYEPQEDEEESEDESDNSSEEDLEEECESSPTKTTEFWHYLNDSKKSKVKKVYADLIEVVKPPVAKSSDSSEGSIQTDLYRCNVCRVETHNLRSIRSHIWQIEIYDPKRCQLCRKVCSNKYSLTMHMKDEHTPGGGYSCSFEGCTHVNKSKRGLRRHKANAHRCRKEISLPCSWDNCDKTFRSHHSLKIHMRIHSDSKPVLCYLCAFRCRQKASLNWHMKTKHPDAPPP